MPVCAAVVPDANGVQHLVLDTTQVDITQCAYVIEDGSSQVWRELNSLTLEQGAELGTLIGVAWSIAFGFKLVLRALRIDETPPV